MGRDRRDEEERDIVARIGPAGHRSAATALAAHVAGACGHVWVDERVLELGYRFHTELSDEIPAFFNKRLSTGATNVAITLQAGIDLDDGSTDAFDGCTSTADAAVVLTSPDHAPTVWQVLVTVGVQLTPLDEVATPAFSAAHPNEFRLLADELVALGVLQRSGCALCRALGDSSLRPTGT